MMNHITEIIPDNLPDRWADAMERGQLFRELLAEIERLKGKVAARDFSIRELQSSLGSEFGYCDDCGTRLPPYPHEHPCDAAYLGNAEEVNKP